MTPILPVATAAVTAAATAVVAWTALLAQLLIAIRVTVAGGGTPLAAVVSYFGYFTILTNLLVALVVTVPRVAPDSKAGRAFADRRVSTSAASGILVVGIIYHLLLRGAWDPQGLQKWTDYGLHYAVPVLFTLHWMFMAPKAGLRFADFPALAIYPVGYLIYIAIRGALIGRYPYYFVDVGQLGYLGAARNAAGLTTFYFVVATILLAVTARQRESVQKRA